MTPHDSATSNDAISKPSWILDARWETMSSEQQLIEFEAEAMLSGPQREFNCLDTSMVWKCFEKGILFEKDIRNYPHPPSLSREQCVKWCRDNNCDPRKRIQVMDRIELVLHLYDFIRIGIEEIGDDVLRRMLSKLADDNTDLGLSYWRSVVNAEKHDIYEWWLIDFEMAENLAEIGQPVLRNEFGNWWGRLSTGQSILMDGVVQQVAWLRRRRWKAKGGDIEKGNASIQPTSFSSPSSNAEDDV